MFKLFRKRKSWKQHFDEGMAYGEAANLEKAEASFRAAIQLAPQEPYPHYELGYTLLLTGRVEGALSEFRKTNELSRGFFLVQPTLYLCEQLLAGTISVEVLPLLLKLQQLVDSHEGRSDKAVGLSKDVIERAPDCPLGHYYLGKALLNQDRNAAEAALGRCLELNPDETTAIDAKMHMGVLRREAGDFDEAYRIWNETLADYEGNPHLSLWELLLKQEEPD